MTNNKIQAYAERIENVLNEIDTLRGDIKDLYDEVKHAEFNPRALRKAIANKRRKADASFDAEVEAYSAALLAMPGATYRSVAEQTGISKSKLQRLVPREENGTAEESGDRQSPARDGEASADVTTVSASSSPPQSCSSGFSSSAAAVVDVPTGNEGRPEEQDLTIPAHLRRIA